MPNLPIVLGTEKIASRIHLAATELRTRDRASRAIAEIIGRSGHENRPLRQRLGEELQTAAAVSWPRRNRLFYAREVAQKVEQSA